MSAGKNEELREFSPRVSFNYCYKSGLRSRSLIPAPGVNPI